MQHQSPRHSEQHRHKGTMKLLLTFTTILFLQFNAIASDTTIVFRSVNYSDVFELAKKEKKAVLLYFSIDGCSPCKTMEKTTFKEKNTIDFYNKNFVAYKINTLKGVGIEI